MPSFSVSKVPVLNIYYLLCYAWQKPRWQGVVDVKSLDQQPDVLNLLSKVLVESVSRLLKRGLHRGYMEIREESRIIRGKIDLGGTLARGLLSTGRVACSHQILSHNVPMNQILKATFNRLRKETGLNVGIRSEVSGLYHRLDSITPVALSKGLFSSIRLSQGQIHYDLPLLICRLLHDYVLFVEDKADSRFADFLRDQLEMWRVFEAFVKAFYQRKKPDYKVESPHIPWDAVSLTPDGESFLPTMRTDITMRRGKETIVIDTKFYSDTFQIYQGSRSINSGNLYQMCTYLRNLHATQDGSCSGILLYPTTDGEVDLRYVIEGHSVDKYLSRSFLTY